ncbi:MAG: NAD(P)-dependent oxidoreductase [Flavobacteriales bacterium]
MKVCFIDTVHPILKERLESRGVRCVMHTSTPQIELEQLIGSYDGIVIRSRIKMDKRFLSKAANLKFIARSGAGMENIDLEFCEQKGIICFNSPEGNRDAVGEQAIGMLLLLFRNILRADAQVRSGVWDREGNRGHELAGKTVGIVGFGNMGSAFASKLTGFGCRIIAYDKYKSGFSTSTIEEVDLETLQSESDVISLHLPQTEETTYYFNSTFIESCSKNFFLINTARGKNVKTEDLVAAMKKGKVLGACLDVIEYEHSSFEKIDTNQLPEPFQYLIASDRVVLSPHVAGWTYESYVKLSSFLAEKIIDCFGL